MRGGIVLLGAYGGGRSACTCSRRLLDVRRAGRSPASSGRSAGGRTAVLHGLPVRPGQGPRPVAEPAAAGPPGRPGGARRVRGPRCRSRRRWSPDAARRWPGRSSSRSRRPRTCCWSRAETTLAARHRARPPRRARDDPRAVRPVLLGRRASLVAVAVAAPWIGVAARPVRPGRPAGPRARLRAGRPVRPAGLRGRAMAAKKPLRSRRRCCRASACQRRARRDVEAAARPSTREPSRIHLAAFPPKERWDDWVELDSRAWPRREEHHYMLVPTTCFNCESACGLLAYVDREDLHVRKFEGNPEHPGSRGRNCAKGPSTLNQVTDPDRILYPLRRVGPRGEGRVGAHQLGRGARRHRRAAAGGDRRERQNEIMVPHRPAGRGRLHRAGAGQLGRRRAQLAHQRLLRGGRTGYQFWMGIDRPSPDHAQRQGDLSDQLAPGGRSLLQPARAAHHRGPARTAPSSSSWTPGCPTPPRTPTTGSRRSRAARRRSTWRSPGT